MNSQLELLELDHLTAIRELVSVVYHSNTNCIMSVGSDVAVNDISMITCPTCFFAKVKDLNSLALKKSESREVLGFRTVVQLPNSKKFATNKYEAYTLKKMQKDGVDIFTEQESSIRYYVVWDVITGSTETEQAFNDMLTAVDALGLMNRQQSLNIQSMPTSEDGGVFYNKKSTGMWFETSEAPLMVISLIRLSMKLAKTEAKIDQDTAMILVGTHFYQTSFKTYQPALFAWFANRCELLDTQAMRDAFTMKQASGALVKLFKHTFSVDIPKRAESHSVYANARVQYWGRPDNKFRSNIVLKAEIKDMRHVCLDCSSRDTVIVSRSNYKCNDCNKYNPF